MIDKQPGNAPTGTGLPVAIGHYEFIRFHLKEPPKEALWMAIFAEARGMPVPDEVEQRYIKEHWHD